ncbi:hypothetical protein LINPERHAP1_LOCUS4771, partial [Linum perenne]
MKRFYSMISKTTSAVETDEDEPNLAIPEIDENEPQLSEDWKIGGISLQTDPALRQRISLFHPNVQDEIR